MANSEFDQLDRLWIKFGLLLPEDSVNNLVGKNNVLNSIRDKYFDIFPGQVIPGYNREDLDDIIKYGLFPSPSSVNPDIYDNLLDLAEKESQFERDFILSGIESGNKFGLDEYELLLLKTSCQLGKYYDSLCKKIRKQNQVMESDENLVRADLRLTNPNEYAIVEKKGIQLSKHHIALLMKQKFNQLLKGGAK